MGRTVIQTHTRENKPIPKKHHPLVEKKVLESNRTVIQNLKRDVPKPLRFSSPTLLKQIQTYVQQTDKNYYLGFGGLGDALLLMAVCWDNPKAKVVFFANQIPFIRSFFELFGVSVFMHDNIMGTPMANHIYDMMRKLPNFKPSAHLADGLNYNDWRNESKYRDKIKSKTSWLPHFGKENSDKPTVIIAPSGSHKDSKRQRYLHHHEYDQLVNKYLIQGYKVYATGSMSDLHHFKLIDKDNFYWLHSDAIYNGKGNTESISLKRMLRIINSAEHVISMDTWLKTYTLLCDIPTTVIETRWDNKYRAYGEDVTDWIFLNSKIWPNIKIQKIEELIA